VADGPIAPLGNGVIDLEVLYAGHAEDTPYPLGFQALDKKLIAFHGHDLQSLLAILYIS
jgi:hypothetical protein